jgi:hypothetical protein
MRTETITRNLYPFDELSEEAKDKARNLWREASCHDEWWECIYDDAKEIGLKITGFDLNNRKEIDGEFTLSAAEVVRNILNNHGETCDTRSTAEAFLKEFTPLYADYLDEYSEKYESREAEEELLEMEGEFLKSLLQDYFSILGKEYDYYYSDEQVEEAIACNEYEFTEEGKRA